MDGDYYVIVRHGHEFMPIRKVAELFYSTVTTVRRNLKIIEGLPRYKSAWITLNDDGDKLLNVLVYTDFLKNKSCLKDKNLAKHLPPFSESEVRIRRGDYQVVKEI